MPKKQGWSRDPGLLERALDERRRFEEALGPEERSWLAQVPVTRLVEALDARPENVRRSWVRADVEALVEEVRRLGSDRWVGRYLRLFLLVLVSRYLAQPSRFVIPPSVNELLRADLTAILDEREPAEGWPYALTRGSFLYRVGLSSGTTLPMGLFFGEAPTWLSQRVVADLETVPRGPWLRGHLRSSTRGELNLESLVGAQQREAEFVAQNPSLVGVCGVTWFFDPVVAEISPHLSYLRDQVFASGGELFAVGTDATTIAHATATSRTRRRLYDEGRYTPQKFLWVWRRAELLRWTHDLHQDSRRGRVGSADAD